MTHASAPHDRNRTTAPSKTRSRVRVAASPGRRTLQLLTGNGQEMGRQIPAPGNIRDARSFLRPIVLSASNTRSDRTPHHRPALYPPLGTTPYPAPSASARFTVRKVLRRYCMRLSHLDQATGLPVRWPKPVRYEQHHPGDLLHVNINKLGRIPNGGGHKMVGWSAGNR